MKKYNRLVGVSILLYIIISVLTGYYIMRDKDQQDRYYNVEINRIYDSLSKAGTFDKLPLHTDGNYRYVKQVSYKSLQELDENKGTEFFEEEIHLQIKILPWYENDILQGYVRFDYQDSSYSVRNVLYICETALLCMEIMILIWLIYIKKQILNPFHRLSELALEIARGHLKGDIKEEQGKYFGKFVWGIGQLKETLSITKKRELELEKEKKQLLLSLSHDIKTPLNTIKLYGKALEEMLYEDEEQKRHAFIQIGEKAKEIEKYLAEIIVSAKEDIVDIQIEQGEFYLNDLVEKVLATYEEQCSFRSLELKVQEFENRLLRGDIDRAQEVFENIFENAFKYGDGRRIEVTFFEEDYCQLIRIFNTGSTIMENECNHIFESFFRGVNSEGKQGNGLGLYVAREIMRKMDGEIFCEQEEDGMSFILVFP